MPPIKDILLRLIEGAYADKKIDEAEAQEILKTLDSSTEDDRLAASTFVAKQPNELLNELCKANAGICKKIFEENSLTMWVSSRPEIVWTHLLDQYRKKMPTESMQILTGNDLKMEQIATHDAIRRLLKSGVLQRLEQKLCGHEPASLLKIPSSDRSYIEFEQYFQASPDANIWLSTMAQDAAAFFDRVAKIEPRIKANLEFYKGKTKLIVKEWASSNEQILSGIKYKHFRLSEIFPSIHDLFIGTMPQSELATLAKKDILQNPNLKSLFQQYEETKLRWKTQVQRQIERAISRKDTKKTVRWSDVYLITAFIDRGVNEILEELPFILGSDEKIVRRTLLHLNAIQNFTPLRIAGEKGSGGSFNPNTGKINLGDEINSYEGFFQVFTHELLHSIFDSTTRSENRHEGLYEGLTDYYTKILMSRLGKYSSRYTYPQQIQLINDMAPYVGIDGLSRIYLGKEVPKATFADLPKITDGGRNYTYVTGINLPTPAERFLCRQILVNLGMMDLNGLDSTKKRKRLLTVREFLDGLFIKGRDVVAPPNGDYTPKARSTYEKIYNRWQDLLEEGQ